MDSMSNECDIEPITVDEALSALRLIDSLRPALTEDQLASIDLSLLESSLMGLADPIGQVQAFIADRLKEIASWLASTVDSIYRTFYDNVLKPVLSGIAGAVSAVASSLTSLSTSVAGFFTQITGALSSLGYSISSIMSTLAQLPSVFLSQLQGLYQSLAGAISSVIDSLSRQVSGILTAISQVPPAIMGGISTAFSTLQGALNTVLTSISGWIQEATKRLTDLGATFQGFVNAVLRLPDAFAQFFKWLAEGIAGIGQALMNFFSDPIGNLQRGFAFLADQIWRLIPDWLKGAISGIPVALKGVADALMKFFKDPIGNLQRAFSFLADQIWKVLPDWLKNAITTIGGALKALWDWLTQAVGNLAQAIQKGFQDFVTWFINGLPTFVDILLKVARYLPPFSFFIWLWEVLTKPAEGGKGTVGDALLGGISSFFGKIGELLGAFWQNIQDAGKFFFDQVGKFIQDPIGTLKDWLNWAGQAIWKLLPQPVQDALTWLNNQLGEFAKDPLGYLSKGLGTIWEKIKDGVELIFRKVTEFISYLASAVLNILSAPVTALAQAGTGILSGIGQVMRGVAQSLANFMKQSLVEVPQQFYKALGEELSKMLKKTGGGGGELDVFFKLLLTMFIPLMGVSLAGSVIKSVGMQIYHTHVRPLAQIRIPFLGFSLQLDIPGAFTWILHELGDALRDIPTQVTNAFSFGLTYVMVRPLEYAFRYMWKQSLQRFIGTGDVPLDLPPIYLTIEAARRAGFLTEGKTGVKDIVDKVKDFMLYHAYPDWFIALFLMKPDEFNVEVLDRFRNPRKLPLSLLYEMPSRSDLVTMMIRDVFLDPNQFVTVMRHVGVYDDVAALYYFTHFRYPPPERLWSFTARALAGLAWYTPAPGEMDDLRAEASFLKAPIPVSPADLNFAGSSLFKALATYMKWHDYARFAWINGFTSDNWIVIDTLADIPTKIDARWMVRWRLFDYMVSKGIGLYSPASDFLKVLDSNIANPKVYMDLTLFSRLIQATGMHPYYVPIVAVAETINAIQEERTHLRTGLLNMLERGIADVATLMDLMLNLTTASFQVAYYDPSSGNLKSGYVNVPISFLPAESVLLVTRSVIDRYLGIYDKVLSSVVSAVRSLVLKPDDAKARIREFGSNVAQTISSTLKALLGRDVNLIPDDNYFDAWLAYALITSDLETRERVRSLAQRIAGWILYRVAYGYVTDEDLQSLVVTLVNDFYFTETEAKAVLDLSRVVRNIVKKEESWPTLSQLASMAEYIDVPLDYIQRVMQERRIEPTYASLWLKYISARTISSEVNRLSTTARTIYQNFALADAVVSTVKALMAQGGWTSRELIIFDLDMQLRRLYRVLSTLIPTLRQFITDAQYLPDWEKLLADLLTARGIEVEKYKQQVEYYKRLIKSRKVMRRVNWYITRMIYAYAYGAVSKDDIRKRLEALKQYGLEDEEIAIIMDGLDLYRNYVLVRYGGRYG